MELKEIEKAIIKKYRTKLYAPFIHALQEYKMLKEGDKVAVCMSGGKDSFLLAKLFQELKKHSDFYFEVIYICMNPGFNQENLDKLKENCEYLNIPVIIKESDVFKVAHKIGGNHPCYMCARMRRGFLYQFAKEQGCNKIALGHHFNDVIETVLINVLYGGKYNTMMPKLHSTNFNGMELIRPMCLIKEKDIINWMHFSEFEAMSCGCKISSNDLPSRRKDVKMLISELKKDFDDVDMNIYRSAENVNLNSCLSWKIGDKKESFFDYYENNKEVEDD